MDVAGFTKQFSIDQGTVLGMDQLFQALFNCALTDPKRQGICAGLSQIWLSRLMMWHNETAAERLKALHSVGGFRWGGKTQDILMKSGAGGVTIQEQIETMYGEALKVYVLRPIWTQVAMTGGDDPDILVPPTATNVSRTGAYCLYNIGLTTNTGPAAHACASYMSHGTIGLNRHFYFFDPNMGEYRINASQVTAFLKAWVRAYKADFQAVTYLLSFAVQRG